MQSSRLTLISLFAGALVGQLLFDSDWNPQSDFSTHSNFISLSIFEFFGFSVFLNLLKLLIIPLVSTSIVSAITGVGEFSKIRKIGALSLALYFGTMLLAVFVGLATSLIIQPGIGQDLSAFSSGQENTSQSLPTEASQMGVSGVFRNLFSLLVPQDLFSAFTSGNTLGVIFISVFFGSALVAIGDKGLPVTKVINSLYAVFTQMVTWVIKLTPLGVFCLLAWTIGRLGLGVFVQTIGVYMLTVLAGLGFHSVITLPLCLLLVSKTKPLKFFSACRQALVTAFATSSSSATLPVTIETATRKAGINRETAGLVLPLGATINMDGTALYEAVAVIFLAQAFGIDLSLAQLVTVAMVATVAAIGAAGIPSAGLVTMIIVIEAVNNTLGAEAGAGIPIAGIALILGVDRILDMARTAVNVWGDLVVCKIVDRSLKPR